VLVLVEMHHVWCKTIILPMWISMNVGGYVLILSFGTSSCSKLNFLNENLKCEYVTERLLRLYIGCLN
jgi:hypothetical protein